MDLEKRIIFFYIFLNSTNKVDNLNSKQQLWLKFQRSTSSMKKQDYIFTLNISTYR